MTKYATNDGDQFEARNASEVLAFLKATIWSGAGATDAAFMADMAARVREQVGTEIQTDTVERFVAGLVAAGLLKVVV